MVLYMKNICECAFSTIHNKFLAYAFIDNSFLQNFKHFIEDETYYINNNNILEDYDDNEINYISSYVYNKLLEKFNVNEDNFEEPISQELWLLFDKLVVFHATN